MKVILKNILSSILLLIFIFYSTSVVNFLENKNNTMMDCSLRKSCTCCEMKSNKSSCCSNHSERINSNLNLPCSHPNFEGINFKLDPVAFLSINTNSLTTDFLEYRAFSYDNFNQTDLTTLLKPPRI